MGPLTWDHFNVKWGWVVGVVEVLSQGAYFSDMVHVKDPMLMVLGPGSRNGNKPNVYYREGCGILCRRGIRLHNVTTYPIFNMSPSF